MQTGNNTAGVQTGVQEQIDLGVMKSGTTVSYPGDTITYILYYYNSGPTTATSVTITDILGYGLIYLTGSPAYATSFVASGGLSGFVWNIGTLTG